VKKSRYLTITAAALITAALILSHFQLKVVGYAGYFQAQDDPPYKSFLPLILSPDNPLASLLTPFSTMHAADGFPEFSWDRVPLYAHLGIGDGLKPEQCHFLADRFQLITFTGGITRNSVETNIAAATRTIKQRNPKAKVLFYWASDMPKHQWKLSNADFPENGYVRPAAQGTKGQRSFDVTRQDVRGWWTDR